MYNQDEVAAHAAIQPLAAEYFKTEGIKQRMNLQLQAAERYGVPLTSSGEEKEPPGAFDIAEFMFPELDKRLAWLKKRATKYFEGTPFGEFVESTPGLGGSLYMVLGRLPRWVGGGYRSVGALWKSVGYHVVESAAPKLVRGEKANFSPQLRAFVAHRIVDPCVKMNGARGTVSPYRLVYEARRGHLELTHPSMLGLGEGCEYCDLARGSDVTARAKRNITRERTGANRQCSEFGGIHWSPKHAQADAMRITGKAILRDCWRVANGIEPRF